MLKRAFPIILALAAFGCGPGPSGGGSASLTDPQQTNAPTDESPAAHAESARLVADAAALGACDEASEGALVYAKAEASFFACAAGAWEPIDLRGKAGAVGKDGKDGKDGSAGADSSSTVWLDPIAKVRWIIAGSGDWETAQQVCSGAYVQPSCGELVAASLHGLYPGLHGAASAWCDGDSNDTYGRIGVIDANPHDEADLKTASHAVYCREEPAD